MALFPENVFAFFQSFSVVFSAFFPKWFWNKAGKTLETDREKGKHFPDLKTQASFVFLPQKFCGNPAGISRKNFVNLMGLRTFYLDS